MATAPLPDFSQPVHFPSMARFAQSGIYFLHLEGEIVYVGQSKNMRARIGQHISEGTKRFDAVSCEPCLIKWLLKREEYYIAVLNPRYNKQLKVSRVVTPMNRDVPLPVNGRMYRPQVLEFLGITQETLDEWRAAGFAPSIKRDSKTRARYYDTREIVALAAMLKEQAA